MSDLNRGTGHDQQPGNGRTPAQIALLREFGFKEPLILLHPSDNDDTVTVSISWLCRVLAERTRLRASLKSILDIACKPPKPHP